MAKKRSKDEQRLDYNAEIRQLREQGPKNLYLLYGPEDYLREQYVTELKKRCLPEGEDSFSFKRLNGPELDASELQQAIDAMPFLTDRSFVEIRGVDLNRVKEPETILALLKDIPEYCTVALVQDTEFEPDGRLKLIKGIFEIGHRLQFNEQGQSALINWIARRFAAVGKGIELEAAQRLIFVSGDLMSKLIPEIEKVAAYAKGDKVTVADVEAVAHHLPEAVIFTMTDYIAEKKYNSAISVLAELLGDKNNEPIAMLAMLGMQMRRLYAARLALDRGEDTRWLMKEYGIRSEYPARILMRSARGFSLPQLKRAVEICAETDYRIKSSGQDDRELLKEAVLRIAAGESNAQA